MAERCVSDREMWSIYQGNNYTGRNDRRSKKDRRTHFSYLPENMERRRRKGDRRKNETSQNGYR